MLFRSHAGLRTALTVATQALLGPRRLFDVVIVSGSSGTGRTALCEHLVASCPGALLVNAADHVPGTLDGITAAWPVDGGQRGDGDRGAPLAIVLDNADCWGGSPAEVLDAGLDRGNSQAGAVEDGQGPTTRAPVLVLVGEFPPEPLRSVVAGHRAISVAIELPSEEEWPSFVAVLADQCGLTPDDPEVQRWVRRGPAVPRRVANALRRRTPKSGAHTGRGVDATRVSRCWSVLADLLLPAAGQAGRGASFSGQVEEPSHWFDAMATAKSRTGTLLAWSATECLALTFGGGGLLEARDLRVNAPKPPEDALGELVARNFVRYAFVSGGVVPGVPVASAYGAGRGRAPLDPEPALYDALRRLDEESRSAAAIQRRQELGASLLSLHPAVASILVGWGLWELPEFANIQVSRLQPAATMLLANAAAHRGEWAMATRLWDALQLDAEWGRAAILNLAHGSLHHGDVRQAGRHIRRVQPERSDEWMSYAAAAVGAGLWDIAGDAVHRCELAAYRLDPNNRSLLQWLAILVDLASGETERLDALLAQLRTGLDPAHAAWGQVWGLVAHLAVHASSCPHDGDGLACASLDRDMVQEALSAAPGEGSVQLAAGDAASRRGDVPSAVRHYELALHGAPEWRLSGAVALAQIALETERAAPGAGPQAEHFNGPAFRAALARVFAVAPSLRAAQEALKGANLLPYAENGPPFAEALNIRADRGGVG